MDNETVQAIQIQLARIASQLETEFGGPGWRGHVHESFAALREDLSNLERQFSGSSRHPGLLTRLDRLEIADASRSRLVSTAMVALIALVVKAFWDLLAK